MILLNLSNRVFGKDNRTYLMGVAMTWIVFFHVYLWCKLSCISTQWWIELFDKGALGVDVFLLLSAYGLQCSVKNKPLRKFYKNRLKRLLPLYFFFLLVLFTTFERHCPLEKMFLQSIFQLSGLSLFMYADFFSCGFCFDWFTPAIILLYISFPIVSKFIIWIENKGTSSVLFVLLLLVATGVWIRENKHFSFGLLAIRMPIIYIGVLMNLFIEHDKINRLLTVAVVAAILGLLCGNEEMRLSLLLLPFLIVLSISCCHFPFKSFFCFIGHHSYEVYLAHIIPVAFIIPLHYTRNVFLLTIITIVVTSLIATFFSLVHTKFWDMADKSS